MFAASTAECERGFSTVNNIKTRVRNSLKTQIASDLMIVKAYSPGIENFKPAAFAFAKLWDRQNGPALKKRRTENQDLSINERQSDKRAAVIVAALGDLILDMKKM